MEVRFHFGFKHELHDRLGNAIRDGRDPERALTTGFLWNQNFLHGRREVTPRAHAIPNPIQVLREVSLEASDRFPVHPGAACVGTHEPPGIPYQPFRNIKRLCRPRALLPSRVGVRWRRDNSTPSLRLHYRTFIATTGRSVPHASPRYSRPCVGARALLHAQPARATGNATAQLNELQVALPGECNAQLFDFAPPADPESDREAIEERAGIIAEGRGMDPAQALQEARWQTHRELSWRAFLPTSKRVLYAAEGARAGLLALDPGSLSDRPFRCCLIRTLEPLELGRRRPRTSGRCASGVSARARARSCARAAAVSVLPAPDSARTGGRAPRPSP
jgi:hypothetical protein